MLTPRTDRQKKLQPREEEKERQIKSCGFLLGPCCGCGDDEERRVKIGSAARGGVKKKRVKVKTLGGAFVFVYLALLGCAVARVLWLFAVWWYNACSGVSSTATEVCVCAKSFGAAAALRGTGRSTMH